MTNTNRNNKRRPAPVADSDSGSVSFSISLSKYSLLLDDDEVNSALQQQRQTHRHKRPATQVEDREEETHNEHAVDLTQSSVSGSNTSRRGKRKRREATQSTSPATTATSPRALLPTGTRRQNAHPQLPQQVKEDEKTITPSIIAETDTAAPINEEDQDFSDRAPDSDDSADHGYNGPTATLTPTPAAPVVLSSLSTSPHSLSDGSYSVSLSVCDNICFYGSVDITVEYGYIRINQHVLSPRSPRCALHSPSWDPAALLCIRSYQPDATPATQTTAKMHTDASVIKLYPSVSAHTLHRDDEGRDMNEYLPIDIPGFYPIKQQSTADRQRISYAPLTVPPAWADLLTSLASPATASASSTLSVLLCGSRNTGKSTFCRLLIHSLLNRYKTVAVIDTDVGQSEFTPPGLVSLITLTHPILSPPHAHQYAPDKAYFIGDTSITQDPGAYLHSIHKLGKYYREHYTRAHMAQMIPLVINTPGWVKGMGLTVLQQMINDLHPSHIVHVTGTAESSTDASSSLLQFSDSMYHTIPRYVCPHSAARSRLSSEKSRLFSLISYFAGRTADPVSFHTIGMILAAQHPYCVQFDTVYLHVQHVNVADTHILTVLNAAIIGLCCSDLSSNDLSALCTHTPVTQRHSLHVLNTLPSDIHCLGLAIVRAIDVSNHHLYLLTPLSVAQLQRVNVLVKGGLELPNILVYRNDAMDVQPYLPPAALTSGSHVGGAAMKSRKNVQRRRLQQ